jgi:hypothetical protein
MMLSSAARPSPAASWHRTTWEGEPAWAAESGEVLAIVSEARARLIHLGPAGRGSNLLSAPVPRPEPKDAGEAPNWGGHRIWLGPQKRWVWPPPRDWEFSSAAASHADGETLVLVHARSDPDLPALERRYRWDGDMLDCTVRWREAREPWYAMHVVAVDAPIAVTVSLRAWDEVPEGWVEVSMQGFATTGLRTHSALEEHGDGRITVRSGRKGGKWGFAPQPLTVARSGGWQLIVEPGPWTGLALGSPDQGYLSQVWVDAGESAFSELEQLSPYLLPEADGWSTSTVRLRARLTVP